MFISMPQGAVRSGPRGLQSLACWDCRFECRRRVVWCRVEVSASGWSLVQRNSTECGVSECDRDASIMRRTWLTRGWRATEKQGAGGKKINIILQFIFLTMKSYLTDCRIPENTNPLHFRNVRDETGFLQDCFEFWIGKN